MTLATGQPYRIIVTGWRDATPEDGAYVASVLHVAVRRPLAVGRPVVIVQGKCPRGGVDLAAESWAEATLGVTNEPRPADWKGRGKAAGPIRNGEMVAAGAEICLAFPGPGSSGTWDCIRQAADAGIHVRIYPLRERK